jgi:hypothetical protein
LILIITNSKDATADYFCQFLTLHDTPFFRFNTDEFLTQYRVDFIFKNGSSHFEIKNLNSNSVISSEQIYGVWYRRPVNPLVNIQDTSSENLKELGLEARLQYETIIRTLTKSLWVSDPDKLRYAEDRVVQLKAAKKIGFKVPETIISNSPETIEAFVNGFDKVCIKALHLGTLDVNGALRMFYTAILEKQDRDVIEKSSLFPLLLQQYIPKKREYRITVVGEDVIPVEVMANDGQEMVDWRIENGRKATFKLASLPESIIQMSRSIVAELGVRFASMDVVESNDGSFYFLDLNPNGQWAWLDQTINTTIAAHLCRLLSEGA